MNKKATNILYSNVIYIILLALFVVGIWTFVSSQMNGAAIWEDYYAKEIVKVINLAQPGDEVSLDVHKATEVARANDINNLDNIFTINNQEKEVCVMLSNLRISCYGYFNDVYIEDFKLEYGIPTNVLSFNVREAVKNE